MSGFDAAGTISKLSVDASTQTTGIGSKTGEESFYSGFLGWDAANHVSAGEPVDTIAGATVSSNAVITALNSAIDCYNNESQGGGVTMAEKQSKWKIFTAGILRENPVLRLVLGLLPRRWPSPPPCPAPSAWACP